MNHFEVLGISRAAGEAEVKEAYFRLARRFHPDAHHGSSLSDLRDTLETVFIQLGEVYEVLRDPVGGASTRSGSVASGAADRSRRVPGGRAAAPRARAPADAAAGARRGAAKERAAEQAIRDAGNLFDQEKYWDAIQLLEPIAQDMRGHACARGADAARPLLPQEPQVGPARRRGAARRDPRRPEGRGRLGAARRHLRRQRDPHARLSMYKKALELAPDHEEAAQYLAAHPPEEPRARRRRRAPAQVLPQALSDAPAGRDCRCESRYPEQPARPLDACADRPAPARAAVRGERRRRHPGQRRPAERPRRRRDDTAGAAARRRYGTLVDPARPRRCASSTTTARVEVVTAPPAPPRAARRRRAGAAAEPARLQLAVTGDSFWQAWDPKTAPADPSLRLELRLDDAPLVSYTDSTLDPEDLPKAVVNSFVFSPEQLPVRAGPGVVVAPPVVVDGEIGLALEVPRRPPDAHELRLAYQAERGHRGRADVAQPGHRSQRRSSSARARR